MYNEEESLGPLIEWIEKVVMNRYDFEVIFVDDGSGDNSWQVVRNLAESRPHMRGILFRRNYGKSAALFAGFESAKGDVVITMDADLQDSPDEIPGLYDMIQEDGYDLVSGWKKKRRDPLSKRLPSKLFNRVVRRVSGIPLHDFNCGLKAYRKDVVKNIEVYGEMHRYIPLLAKWSGYGKIGEKVVEHFPRKYGKSKFGIERLINGFLDVMSIMFVGKFGKRPMHFFGTIGFFASFLGFAFLVYLTILRAFKTSTFITDRPLFYLGILLLIVGSQLFLTGFVSELIVRNSAGRNRYGVKERIR